MIRNLTDKQKLFIEYFSSTGNATASCIKAGYSKATAEQQGYELKNKLQAEIETATKKILSGSVPIAVDVLTKLVSDPKDTTKYKTPSREFLY
jgi:phage terminase small subunit